MRVSHEALPNDITGLFVSSPKFETTTAYLNFFAGSLHQDPSAPAGVAHFLEHTPFQGTEQFPSLWEFTDYIDVDGTSHNAWTTQADTRYFANGIDPMRVINTVFQLGFHPLLTEEGLNHDRNAVIEEARSNQFDPYRPELEDYLKAFGGSRYAELITGNIDDVQAITHQHIIDFYRRHYQPGNSQILVCSPLTLTQQRRIVRELASNVDTSRTDSNPPPARFDLQWLLNPDPVTTFHNKRDDAEAQSAVSVGYHLEMPRTFPEYVLHELGASLIYRSLHHLLRDDLNLVYGVNADYGAVENIGHGQLETYYSLEMGTQLVGSNMISALDAILRVEAGIGGEVKQAESALLARVRKIKKIMESGSEETADAILESAQVYYEKTFDLEAELAMVRDFSAADVVKTAAKMMSDKRLTSIAGPVTSQLKRAAAHAERHL